MLIQRDKLGCLGDGRSYDGGLQFAHSTIPNYCSERPIKGSIHAAFEECTTATGASEGLERQAQLPKKQLL